MRALHGKKVSFDKVIKMVDDMVTLLGKEQVDDGSQKDMCEISIDKAEDDMHSPRPWGKFDQAHQGATSLRRKTV